MRKFIFLIILLMLADSNTLFAQEIKAKVSVVASRVGSQTDRKVFQTLQTALTNMINNRKWTNDVFQQEERIDCNFLINIDKALDNDTYIAALTIQAARPIYGSSYQSPLVNFQDNALVFKYVEFQSVEFNENRVQGTDPMASNLTATLAYYIYIILGMDYNSFSPKGGEVYFQKAQNIVNNAPEGREINGWKAFDGNRNRYWLTENLLNTRYNLIHDVMYEYFRNGFDQITTDPVAARKAVLAALNKLSQMNQNEPNSMILPFFMQGRSNEIIKLFSKSPMDEKVRARDLLIKIDISNAAKYQQELK